MYFFGLLLSHFSRVRLCVTTETAAHQTPPSLGFSRQEHWSGVGCHFLLQCMKVKSKSEVAQLCLTPSNPMDSSLPGSSVHGIFQARVLEWDAIAFSSYVIRELQTHVYQNGQNPEHWQHQMLVSIWSNRNAHSLLMGMNEKGYSHVERQFISFLQNWTHSYHTILQSSSLVFTQRRRKFMSKNLHMNIYSSFFITAKLGSK